MTYLSLIPVGPLQDGGDGVHGCELVCVRLHLDPRIEPQGQQDVDQLEKKHVSEIPNAEKWID